MSSTRARLLAVFCAGGADHAATVEGRAEGDAFDQRVAVVVELGDIRAGSIQTVDHGAVSLDDLEIAVDQHAADGAQAHRAGLHGVVAALTQAGQILAVLALCAGGVGAVGSAFGQRAEAAEETIYYCLCSRNTSPIYESIS